MMKHGKRAAIIGAGLGGIAVALRLAARGWAVDVYEQNHAPGGKMNRWTTNGFRFDTGPSLITMPHIFEELFQAADLRLADYLELQQMVGLTDYHFDDGARFSHSSQLPDWLSTVRRLEEGDDTGFLNFMALGARLFKVSEAAFFRKPPFGRPKLADLRNMRDLPLRFGWGNYNRTICHFFRSPYLRRMFNRYATYVGSSPYHAPATLTVIPYIEQAFGGWHVRGGLYRLVEVLCERAAQFGVEFHTDCRVEAITQHAGRATGVALAHGPAIEADAVIMNGDASMAPVLLGRDGAVPLAKRDRSLSGLFFLYALKRSLPDQPHHQVFFSADYRTEFQQLFAERRFPDDPTVYVNMPSRSDRSMVPGEGEVLFIMANAPASDRDTWDEPMIENARQRVLARLRKSGFPEFESQVAAATVWTPKRIAHQYGMPGGAIYGQASHGWRGAFLRPPNKDRHTAGLYYVGGSTHPGGGTPTVLMSAEITSKLILDYEMA